MIGIDERIGNVEIGIGWEFFVMCGWSSIAGMAENLEQISFCYPPNPYFLGDSIKHLKRLDFFVLCFLVVW